MRLKWSAANWRYNKLDSTRQTVKYVDKEKRLLAIVYVIS